MDKLLFFKVTHYVFGHVITTILCLPCAYLASLFFIDHVIP